MEYRALALDMDGTVLTTDKKISLRTQAAVRAAMDQGKEVFFATGRCLAEVRPGLKYFPDMHYALCLCGSVVLDLHTGEALVSRTISPEVAEQILAVAESVDSMVTLYAGDDVFVENKRRGNMAYFGCQCFAKLYEDCAVWVEDIREVLDTHRDQIHKAVIFCHTTEDWVKVGEELSKLPLEYASGIPNDYEIAPAGVNKGEGLRRLCESIGIPLEQTIAVGDEATDVPMIKTAGLGVAMGNSPDWVKAEADYVTADCDHDGVAEVIEKYLLV